jgi:uncharacterized protein (DUF302 family)
MTYEDAQARLPEALKNEGFGVITQIDIQATLKEKLGVDFRRYRIFGACNPTFAHSALLKDPHVGVLLPCNVVLYERDDGRAVIGAIDPMQTLGTSAEGAGLSEIAREIGARLGRVIDTLAA